MNLFSKLNARHEAGNPIRVGVIGAGKFASMFFAQAMRLPGVHIVSIVDLKPDVALSNLENVGWEKQRYSATSFDDALKNQSTFVHDDWLAIVSHPQIDIIIESTGNPMAAVTHILGAMKNDKDVINVTVEADAFCGPALGVMHCGIKIAHVAFNCG